MKIIVALLCAASFISVADAQVIIKKAECFFDTDPGFDKASGVLVPSNSGNVNIDFYARIDSLSAGLHTFCLRTANDSGWSITNCTVMLKQIPQPAKAALTRTEYFFDNDPYFGKAQGSFSLPYSVQDSLVDITAITDTLKEGIHVLYLRTVDADNQWSITNNWLFLKQVAANKPNLVRAEYFFDTDPGFGLGNPVALSASVNIINQDEVLNTAGLDSGFHYFFLRTYDANGSWSITSRDTFTYKGRGTLPLSLLSFIAVQKGNDGMLTWQTANETNTSYFEIQHSADGIHWTVSSSVNSIGNTQNGYSFLYKNLQSGNNFFRLKQVDANGTFTYSIVRNIYYSSASDKHLKITPNPVSNGGTLWLSGDVFTKGKTVVTVIGSTGIRYQQQKFDAQASNTVSLILNKYISSGIYFIEIKSASGKQTGSFLVH